MARNLQPLALFRAAPNIAFPVAPRPALLVACVFLFFLSACAVDPSTLIRTPRVAESTDAPPDDETKEGDVAQEESAEDQELPPELTDAVEKPEQIAAIEIDLTNFKERLLGLDGEEITELLGKPKFERNEPPARIWQYQSNECFVDLFLFEESGDLTVDHVEVRGKQVEKTDEKVCFASLLKAVNGAESPATPLGPVTPKKSSDEQPAPDAVKVPAVQQQNLQDDAGEEIAPPIIVNDEPEIDPDSEPEVPAFGSEEPPEEPTEEPQANPATKPTAPDEPEEPVFGTEDPPEEPVEAPSAEPRVTPAQKPAPKSPATDEPEVPAFGSEDPPGEPEQAPQTPEKITADEEDEPEVEFKMEPAPSEKAAPKPAPEPIPEPVAEPEPTPAVEEPVQEPPVEQQKSQPSPEPVTKPEPKTEAPEDTERDSLDSDEVTPTPSKPAAEPAKDELPNAPKLGTTQADDDLLEEPAP